MILLLLYLMVAIFVYEVTEATVLKALFWPIYLVMKK